MNGNRERKETAVPHGSVVRLSEEREIAIYRRGGVAWIADFKGGRAELFTAGEWFALNGRGSALRRAGRDSIAALPARLVERIERLHGAADRTPLAALVAWLRHRLAGFSSALSGRRAAGGLGPRIQHS